MYHRFYKLIPPILIVFFGLSGVAFAALKYNSLSQKFVIDGVLRSDTSSITLGDRLSAIVNGLAISNNLIFPIRAGTGAQLRYAYPISNPDSMTTVGDDYVNASNLTMQGAGSLGIASSSALSIQGEVSTKNNIVITGNKGLVVGSTPQQFNPNTIQANKLLTTTINPLSAAGITMGTPGHLLQMTIDNTSFGSINLGTAGKTQPLCQLVNMTFIWDYTAQNYVIETSYPANEGGTIIKSRTAIGNLCPTGYNILDVDWNNGEISCCTAQNPQ